MDNTLLIVIGLVLLTLGGDALIRGALGLARHLQVSALLTGLVVVGFGTSVPELVVSIDASVMRQHGIAVGNVVGSNISNVLLILGLCALIYPLTARPLSLRRDAVTAVAAGVLFIVLSMDGTLSRVDAMILLIAFSSYIVWAYWTEHIYKVPSAELREAEAQEHSKLPHSLFWIVVVIVFGLGLLIGGSRTLLLGAIGIAESFGISEAVIGLTVVAVGTSLPELSISVIAAIRKHADVAVGNVLGSNIFNLLGILGISAAIHPLQIHSRILHFDQWVLIGSSLIILWFLFTDRLLSRQEGGVLLLGYLLFVWLSFT